MGPQVGCLHLLELCPPTHDGGLGVGVLPLLGRASLGWRSPGEVWGEEAVLGQRLPVEGGQMV